MTETSKRLWRDILIAVASAAIARLLWEAVASEQDDPGALDGESGPAEDSES